MMNRVGEQDFSILDTVMARLIKRGPFTDPTLGLEVLSGEYKGVVFSFKTFEMMPQKMANGMVPTKYEVEIHIKPDNLVNWNPDDDENFDHYTAEVLIAWLSYLHTHDLAPLIKSKPNGIH